MGLDRGPRIVGVDPGAGAPSVDEDFSEGLHRDIVARRRAKIPAGRPAGRRLCEHRASEGQIPGERLEHVLPGTDRRGVSHRHGFARRQVMHDVGDDPIDGPVAAADHVAGPHRGQLHTMLGQPLGREVAATIRRRQEFRGAFAGAIGIAAAHRVGFIVRPAVVVRLVTLVARDHEHGAGAGRSTGRVSDGIQKRCRTDDVR